MCGINKGSSRISRIQQGEQERPTLLVPAFFMYYIYILYSRIADKFYVGYSDNPQRRLIEHNTKPFNTYTSKYRPWILRRFSSGEIEADAV